VDGLTYLNTASVVTPYTKKNGVGDVDPRRLDANLEIVSNVFGIPKVAAGSVWTSVYLPSAKERSLAAK